MTTRTPGDLSPYIMEEEQRATLRIEGPPPANPEFHDLWIVVGLLIFLGLIALVIVLFALGFRKIP